MINLIIETGKLIELIKQEFESMKNPVYDSSTTFLGQVDGIEFQLTLTRDEGEMTDSIGQYGEIIYKEVG